MPDESRNKTAAKSNYNYYLERKQLKFMRMNFPLLVAVDEKINLAEQNRSI